MIHKKLILNNKTETNKFFIKIKNKNKINKIKIEVEHQSKIELNCFLGAKE
jgi:hypothetical protein